MGRFATHAIVMAKLVVGNKQFGVCPFIVQLRDLETHKHMPGVKCGDLGPKLGVHGKDNGWCKFDQVRIPRDNMLQKFVSVDQKGKVSMQGDLRVLYSTMLFMRALIVTYAPLPLIQSSLIALRYSTVRRQFKNISS